MIIIVTLLAVVYVDGSTRTSWSETPHSEIPQGNMASVPFYYNVKGAQQRYFELEDIKK